MFQVKRCTVSEKTGVYGGDSEERTTERKLMRISREAWLIPVQGQLVETGQIRYRVSLSMRMTTHFPRDNLTLSQSRSRTRNRNRKDRVSINSCHAQSPSTLNSTRFLLGRRRSLLLILSAPLSSSPPLLHLPTSTLLPRWIMPPLSSHSPP